MKSDGSTAKYYELPEGCTQLQDLISHRNMNAQDGEIFRAIYRKGMASHSDALRDAKKVLFYAKAEVERLERLEKAADLGAYCSKSQPQLPDGYTKYDMPDGGWVAYRESDLSLGDGWRGSYRTHNPTGVRIYQTSVQSMARELYKLDHPSIIKYTPT